MSTIQYMVLAFSLVLMPTTASFAQTTVYCPPVEDATIGTDSPNTNYGCGIRVWPMLLGYDTNQIYSGSSNPPGPLGYGRVLARFDLSSLPSSALVSSARLRVKFQQSNGHSFTLVCDRIDQSWSECTVTYNNRPTNFTQIASGNYPFPSGMGSFYLDITSTVQEWVNGSRPNYGVMLVKDDAATDMYMVYQSREYSPAPPATSYGIEVTYSSPCTAPQIATHPQSQTVPFGTSATLTVVANGTQPLSYQWYRGESPTTIDPIAGATSSSYQTPALTSTSRYWVAVRNDCGTANSATAVLSVGCTPAMLLIEPQDMSIYAGETASLSVTATGTPPFTYQWYRLDANQWVAIGGGNAAQYTTDPLQSTTIYRVQVNNTCGSIYSRMATVVVNPPRQYYIEFERTSVNGFVAVGTYVTISGTLRNADGSAVPNYQLGVVDGFAQISTYGPTSDSTGRFSYTTTAKVGGLSELAFILPDSTKQAIYSNVSDSSTAFANNRDVMGFESLALRNNTQQPIEVVMEIAPVTGVNLTVSGVIQPGQTLPLFQTESKNEHFPWTGGTYVGTSKGFSVGAASVDVTTVENSQGVISVESSITAGALLARGKIYVTNDGDFGGCWAPGPDLGVGPVHVDLEGALCLGSDGITVGGGFSALGVVAGISWTIKPWGDPSGLTILRIRPKAGKPGSTVTIYGSGFDPKASRNRVYFGAFRAQITGGNGGSLQVVIPKRLPKGQVDVYVVAKGQTSNRVWFQVK